MGGATSVCRECVCVPARDWLQDKIMLQLRCIILIPKTGLEVGSWDGEAEGCRNRASTKLAWVRAGVLSDSCVAIFSCFFLFHTSVRTPHEQRGYLCVSFLVAHGAGKHRDLIRLYYRDSRPFLERNADRLTATASFGEEKSSLCGPVFCAVGARELLNKGRASGLLCNGRGTRRTG
jgi:hypothetical protein